MTYHFELHRKSRQASEDTIKILPYSETPKCFWRCGVNVRNSSLIKEELYLRSTSFLIPLKKETILIQNQCEGREVWVSYLVI